jgi:NAD(P)-dependent dehydrogenase (short-subunit alcohol dehydrogenase family)
MSDAGFLESVDRMWRVNLQSAALAAHMAEVFMTPLLLPPTVPNEIRGRSSHGGGGLVVLTGAGAALDPSMCTGMVGYGVSKSATHFLVKAMAVDPGLRKGGVTALSLLPSTIDTSANRKAMPDADFGEWTKVGVSSWIKLVSILCVFSLGCISSLRGQGEEERKGGKGRRGDA